jgi:kinesin family protein C1
LIKSGGDKKLKIEGTGAKHINVANLSRHEITSKNQLSNLVKRATKRRKTASTNCNERSSRSHSGIFQLLKISTC